MQQSRRSLTSAIVFVLKDWFKALLQCYRFDVLVAACARQALVPEKVSYISYLISRNAAKCCGSMAEKMAVHPVSHASSPAELP